MTSPDLFTGLGFRIQGHLKIYEYDNREQYKAGSPARMLLNRRNAIHKDNVSILAAKTITNLSPGHLAYMVFGNGGTTVDSTGTVVFNPPRDTGINRDIYNPVFFSLVDETTGALAGNQMGVRHIANTLFSDSEIRCLIGQNEPFGQLPLNTLPTITEPTTILNINTTKFAFDEIGLKLADGTLITHVIFVPVVKTASSLIEVVYTLRVMIAPLEHPPPVHFFALTGVQSTAQIGAFGSFDICALTSVGGRWNPDYLCSTNTRLANNNRNMLFDGFGDFGSGGQCASTTSHSPGSGKFYFELEYVTGSASGAYLRAAIDFNAMLLWFAPQGQFDIRNIVGIGTTLYCQNQAVSYVAQPGFDPGGQSIGFGTEIGSFGYNWWFEGSAFKNGHIASQWITWEGQPDNVDNPSDPATGVGGLDISFLPGGDYHIVCMMWDFGLSDAQITIRTADTGGFLFTPPNGFCAW